jgi:hypothetical protein
MNTSRGIFLATCQKIFVHFEPLGFRATEKCQRLKKKSKDKDLTFEIYFQSSSLNTKEHVTFIPHVHIFSKKLREETMKITKNPHENGYVEGGNIGNISDEKVWKEWDVNEKNQDKVVREVIQRLEEYALPLFQKYERLT